MKSITRLVCFWMLKLVFVCCYLRCGDVFLFFLEQYNCHFSVSKSSQRRTLELAEEGVMGQVPVWVEGSGGAAHAERAGNGATMRSSRRLFVFVCCYLFLFGSSTLSNWNRSCQLGSGPMSRVDELI